MKNKYKKLLGTVNLVEPPKGLRGRVLSFIKEKEAQAAKIRAWMFGSGSALSFGLSLWAVTYLTEKVQETGFWQYFSLLFSGDGTVYMYWKELTLSLAESLPIVSFIVFLAAIGFFIWTSANALRNRNGFSFSFN
jgi:hypothetical protein